jgi:hypothetical protein
MTGPPVAVLIAASPGPLREALLALLLTLPQVAAVSVADRPEDILHYASTNSPGLVVMVLETHFTWFDLPDRIRKAAPASRLAVLVDGEAKPLPADLVLHQGTHPKALVSALVSLLE